MRRLTFLWGFSYEAVHKPIYAAVRNVCHSLATQLSTRYVKIQRIWQTNISLSCTSSALLCCITKSCLFLTLAKLWGHRGADNVLCEIWKTNRNEKHFSLCAKLLIAFKIFLLLYPLCPTLYVTKSWSLCVHNASNHWQSIDQSVSEPHLWHTTFGTQMNQQTTSKCCPFTSCLRGVEIHLY